MHEIKTKLFFRHQILLLRKYTLSRGSKLAYRLVLQNAKVVDVLCLEVDSDRSKMAAILCFAREFYTKFFYQCVVNSRI